MSNQPDRPFCFIPASREYLAGNRDPLFYTLSRRGVVDDQLLIPGWIFFLLFGYAAIMQSWQDWDSLGKMILLFVAVFAALGYATHKFWRVKLRARRLVYQGQCLPGRVVSCVGFETGGEDSTYNVNLQYEFELPDGRIIRKRESGSRSELAGLPLPQPGQPIVVLYLSDEHYLLL